MAHKSYGDVIFAIKSRPKEKLCPDCGRYMDNRGKRCIICREEHSRKQHRLYETRRPKRERNSNDHKPSY